MATLIAAPLRAFLRAAVAAAALTLCMPVKAQPTDTQVKAAFLPRFARYASWPAPAMPKGSNPFVLCVIGSDPFGNLLDSAARTQSVDGRRIVVRRTDNATSVDDCQIAFVAGARAGQLLAAIGAKPVLTVTDGANGHRGIIHFTLADGRVRFFIDQASAARRGIQISSRLLALAVGVKQ